MKQFRVLDPNLPDRGARGLCALAVMCPFRAIRRDALAKLDMREETYGWNLEMQMKAARAGFGIVEIPVNHRRRTGGESKVSGTLQGTFVAGTRIIATLFRVAASRPMV